MTISILLKSGGTVTLKRAFVAGNGIAGDIGTGRTIRIADEDIEEIKEMG